MHNKTLNKTYVTSKDSGRPVQSLRVDLCLDSSEAHDISEDWSDCADAHADLSLCWLYKSYCTFCHVLAHLFFLSNL